jgi:hypothetical protein
MNIRELVAFFFAAALLVSTAGPGQTQTLVSGSTKEKDCTVRREASGLIRGDRIPRGCVLVNEGAEQRGPDWPDPAIVCEETLFHTPNVKKVAVTNCVRLSGGRMIIPTVPPTGGRIEERHFGPIQTRFGPAQRHFGPIQSRFGPTERHFGPLERNFGSSTRSTGSGKDK